MPPHLVRNNAQLLSGISPSGFTRVHCVSRPHTLERVSQSTSKEIAARCMVHPSAIPWVYWVIFGWYEPLLTVLGCVGTILYPKEVRRTVTFQMDLNNTNHELGSRPTSTMAFGNTAIRQSTLPRDTRHPRTARTNCRAIGHD